ncbi:hypothetical protein TRFO_17822 [Tritrichomonas foetus]|uniref:Uncharacterized protein n=1 Tax=Tritrichomonas foetus TaxID=1144522 RepID=A0A1J4KSA2_9EUKA|nr:hypothetical protein TRFO_17822 [Tritrichomonas foetus]|eukprot:OHT12349.1 hypothetical protein TRFO_17822 [Tritrichomonas foetus]
MSFCRESKASQVQAIEAYQRKCLENSGKIYTTRKDISKIRSRLHNLVTSPDYWMTLARFIHGGCPKQKFDEAMAVYLPNNEAKKLHNEFIRAILFNAHFSSVPPPEYISTRPTERDDQRKSFPQNQFKNDIKVFNSYSAADLRHLPSLDQLSKRVAILTDMDVDEAANMALFHELKSFIVSLLTKCVQLRTRNYNSSRSMTITPAQILHTVNNCSELRSIISPSILAKFELY